VGSVAVLSNLRSRLGFLVHRHGQLQLHRPQLEPQILGLAAAGIGKPPRQFSYEEAELTRSRVGFEFAGRFRFRPIWERISTAEPELFH
jgi:hypothetical protein